MDNLTLSTLDTQNLVGRDNPKEPGNIRRGVARRQLALQAKRILTALAGHQIEPDRGPGSDRTPRTAVGHVTKPSGERTPTAQTTTESNNKQSKEWKRIVKARFSGANDASQFTGVGEFQRNPVFEEDHKGKVLIKTGWAKGQTGHVLHAGTNKKGQPLYRVEVGKDKKLAQYLHHEIESLKEDTDMLDEGLKTKMSPYDAHAFLEKHGGHDADYHTLNVEETGYILVETGEFVSEGAAEHVPYKMNEEDEYGDLEPGHYIFKYGFLVSEGYQSSSEALAAFKELSDHTGVAIYQVKENGDIVPGAVKTLDELKKSTLGSYINKATDDATVKSYMGAMVTPENPKSAIHHAKRVSKRVEGIRKATDRLTKEETVSETILEPKPSGQGHDPEHTVHPLHHTITKHNYKYSHSTPIRRIDNSQYISHVYKHGAHNVTTHSDPHHERQIWTTSTLGSPFSSGIGIPELEAHLKSKAKRHNISMKENSIMSIGNGDPALIEGVMKLKPEHYEKLKVAIHSLMDKHPNSEAHYAAAGKTPMRHRWDALHGSKIMHEPQEDGHSLGHHIYKYVNDNHIDTALKHIVASHKSGVKENSIMSIGNGDPALLTDPNVNYAREMEHIQQQRKEAIKDMLRRSFLTKEETLDESKFHEFVSEKAWRAHVKKRGFTLQHQFYDPVTQQPGDEIRAHHPKTGAHMGSFWRKTPGTPSGTSYGWVTKKSVHEDRTLPIPAGDLVDDGLPPSEIELVDVGVSSPEKLERRYKIAQLSKKVGPGGLDQ